MIKIMHLCIVRRWIGVMRFANSLPYDTAILQLHFNIINIIMTTTYEI